MEAIEERHKLPLKEVGRIMMSGRNCPTEKLQATMEPMSSPVSAQKIWLDDDYLWVILSDGRQLATPLAYFPRLLHATKAQGVRFEVSGDGTGIHWEALDEDISVEGLVLGIRDHR